ncbi:MAG: tetratricopeptide repeat protein [Alistipes sp.]|nr:tetratricopeptide repeat protein [Alistipes sp.]
MALGLVLLGVALPESAVAQYFPERKLVRDGNDQFKTRNYNNALKKYDEAYLKDSTKYETLYNRANGYYHKKANTPNDAELTYETSNALYEKIAADTLLTDVQRAEVYRNLGESLFAQQEYEAALNTFRESLRLNPADKETKYNYVLTKRIVDQKRAVQQQNQNQNQNQNQDQNQDQNGGGGENNENNQNNDNSDQNKDQNQDQNGGNDNQQGDNQQNGEGDGDKEQEGENDPNGGNDNREGVGDNEEQNGAPQPKELSPEKERMLDAIQAEEDKTQDKLGEKKRGVIIPGKKNW